MSVALGVINFFIEKFRINSDFTEQELYCQFQKLDNQQKLKKDKKPLRGSFLEK